MKRSHTKRNLFLASAVVAVALFSACAAEPVSPATREPVPAATAQPIAPSRSRVLVAYFSRWGNTPYPANIDASASASVTIAGGTRQGTTERLARDIQAETDGDLFLIQSKASYPVNFDDLVEQNHQEIGDDLFPPLVHTPDTRQYDVIFVGYPVWANTIPRPVATFIRDAALAGKTVIPFCTHDGYSSGRSYADIRRLAPEAAILDGLAVEAGDVPGARETVRQWIAGLPLPAAAPAAAPRLTVDGTEISASWEDTPLAREILSHVPLSVSMVNYGGREYYGSIDFRPENGGQGKRNFEDGDITYCPGNNTIAIFYAQTDNPTLTMDVIKIGKVTSDLSRFHQLGHTIQFQIQ